MMLSPADTGAGFLHSAVYRFAPAGLDTPRWAGPYAQAWYLAWVADQAPEVARALHASDGRRPYTLAIDTRAGWLRLTSFDPDRAPLPGIRQGEARPADRAAGDGLPALRVHHATFPLELASTAVETFSGLVRAGAEGAATSLPALTFRTPTLFRSNNLDVPLPDPALTFGSLARAWDAFAPLPLPTAIGPFVHAHVTVAQAAIRTQRVTVPHKGARVGFTGRVRFAITAQGWAASPPATETRAVPIPALLGALIRFAPFAGIGAGTAAGFGAVELVG